MDWTLCSREQPTERTERSSESVETRRPAAFLRHDLDTTPATNSLKRKVRQAKLSKSTKTLRDRLSLQTHEK